METATTFVPGNLSCLFVVCPDNNPAIAGSLGLGFTVNKGVTVEVQLSEKTEVQFNGKKIDFPTVEAVIQRLFDYPERSEGSSEKRDPLLTPQNDNLNVQISLSSDLPLGAGFGLSGASALATAYALNDLFKLHKPKLELAKIAHVAEVENGTGLGDVVNEYYGGFLLKTVPSSQFSIYRIPIAGIPVYCKYFSKLPTKNILSDKKKFDQINKAGEKALKKIHDLGFKIQEETCSVYERNMQKLFAQIIQISKEFAEESGLLTDQQVITAIGEIESRGGHASMIMLGNAVFSDIPFEGSIKLTIC